MSNTTPPPGSYQKTSKDITFDQDSHGNGLLKAQCNDVNGNPKASQLQYDVANMNGVLTAQPGGSYQKTSKDITMVNGSDGVYLSATCQKKDGSWIESKLKIEDIANCDGVLTYGSC